MSKYIKLEDAIHNINLEVTGRKEYIGDMKANLFFALDDLPTIEVSEDCISREYLEEQLQQIEDITAMAHIDLGEDPYDETEAIMLPISTVRKIFKNAPSVTTEQSSKVGEWHRVSADKYVQHAYHHFRCSECGEDTIGEPNYCPNCGAKMKG